MFGMFDGIKVWWHVRKLQNGSDEERRKAAMKLGELKDARAVEPLIEALKDETAGVRASAAWALGDIVNLGKIIRKGEFPARGTVVGAVMDELSSKEFDDAKAVESLIGMLGDGDRFVREHATMALGKIGDVKALEPLIKALEDADVRGFAAWALGAMRDERAVGPLISMLGNKDEVVRGFAAGALEKIGEPAVKHLVEAARDPDKKPLRGAISRILKRMDENEQTKRHDFGCRETEILKPPEIPREFQRLMADGTQKVKLKA